MIFCLIFFEILNKTLNNRQNCRKVLTIEKKKNPKSGTKLSKKGTKLQKKEPNTRLRGGEEEPSALSCAHL